MIEIDGDDVKGRICSRCLVIVSAASYVRAVYGPEGNRTREACDNPTDPRYLRSWAERMLWANGAMIEIDNRAWAFDPVGTYHGDAVCGWHLRECIQAEQHGHGGGWRYP